MEGGRARTNILISSFQVVSYSIQRSVEGASGTHVFISDADTTDKIEEQMFNTLGGGGLPHPSGKISIWEPRQDALKKPILKLDKFNNENEVCLTKLKCCSSDMKKSTLRRRYQNWTSSALKN